MKARPVGSVNVRWAVMIACGRGARQLSPCVMNWASGIRRYPF
jgi:hypothetical protein